MKRFVATLLFAGALATPTWAQTTTTNPAPVPGSRQQDAPEVVKPTDSTKSEPKATEQVPPNAQSRARSESDSSATPQR